MCIIKHWGCCTGPDTRGIWRPLGTDFTTNSTHIIFARYEPYPGVGFLDFQRRLSKPFCTSTALILSSHFWSLAMFFHLCNISNMARSRILLAKAFRQLWQQCDGEIMSIRDWECIPRGFTAIRHVHMSNVGKFGLARPHDSNGLVYGMWGTSRRQDTLFTWSSVSGRTCMDILTAAT